MKIEQLLATLSTRGVTQAALRAGPQMQLQIGGQWQAQSATLTDETLSALIDEALDPASRVAWDHPEGRAGFEMQGFSVAARRSDGAVQILIKQLVAAPNGGALSTAQTTAPATTQTTAPATTPVQATSAFAPAASPFQASATPLQATGLAPEPQWFAVEGESEKGPFPLQKMQMMVSMGTLAPQTLVWREGMEGWAAVQNTELAGFVPAAQAMAPIASPTGEVYQSRGRIGIGGNDSGTGESAQLPPGVSKWNWGAFFFPVFWGWSHGQSGRAWAILLTGFIPVVGSIISFVLTIMMAIQGNPLAWKYRRWDDVDHLRKTEQIWGYWAIGSLTISALIVLIAVLGHH